VISSLSRRIVSIAPGKANAVHKPTPNAALSLNAHEKASIQQVQQYRRDVSFVPEHPISLDFRCGRIDLSLVTRLETEGEASTKAGNMPPHARVSRKLYHYPNLWSINYLSLSQSSCLRVTLLYSSIYPSVPS